MRVPAFLTSALLAAVLVGGCSTRPTASAPTVPPTLRPASGEVLFLEARASGVQIYECAPKGDPASAYEWTFRAPEATLADRNGRSLGKHYAGPTWESSDGSSVVGEIKARDPGPNPTAIPWLLLGAKATKGAGVFSPTTSIQRLQTVGGVAPSEPCTVSTAARIARVPYTATYYFYRAAP